MSNEFDKTLYDENYYQTSFGGIPYNRQSENGYWLQFFKTIANVIVKEYKPVRVLDVGCAKGFIVEALRDNDVSAFGIDISETAISEVRDDIKPFCKIASIDDPSSYDGLYDLIICIEVLEHVTEEMAEKTIELMCAHTSQILFSSSPSDFEEPTHINVQPPTYWENIFSKFGFIKAHEDWASKVIAAHTIIFRKRTEEQLQLNSLKISEVENKVDQLSVQSNESFRVILDQINQLKKENNDFKSALLDKDRIFVKILAENEDALKDKERHIQNIESILKTMQNTKGWRILEKIRRIKNFVLLHKWRSLSKVANKIKERGVSGTIQLIDEKLDNLENFKSYDQWFRDRLLTDLQTNDIRNEISEIIDAPLISIVMPAYNTDEIWLRKAIESVINQIYPFWELCICDDRSPNANVWEIMQEYANKDDRIKIVRSNNNLGIAGSTNKAIELASGSYVGFLDHDDELTNNALYEVVRVIISSQSDMIYSDEDKLEMDGTYSDPFFKPDWSPDYLMSTNYICHFAVYRKSIGDSLGWISLGFDGAQDYEFVLRFTEKSDKITHISKILYHWRKIPGSTAESYNSKSYAQDAGERALRLTMERKGIKAKVSSNKNPGHYRVERELIDHPLVSIIIPTKDRVDLISVCIRSIIEKTRYQNYEIIVVDNNSSENETFEFFNEMKNSITVMHYNKPFNYSAINNEAVKISKGSVLLFLNNDTEIIESKWLEAMIEQIQRDEVGIVGAKLLYTNNTVQHAGVILGIGGVANHAFLNLHKDVNGYFGMLHDIRNCSAVTGACMMVPRDIFEEIGGFNEKSLPVGFNDIDLSLKIVTKGYLCVWTPYAVLYHHESATRSRDVDVNEVDYMRKTWAQYLDNDPYYNSNFDRSEVTKSYSKLI